MEIKELLQQAEERMNKSIEALKHEFASIRTGRASVALLDKVMVDYYGSPSPINQVANISVPEPRMIVIAPWIAFWLSLILFPMSILYCVLRSILPFAS